MTSVSDGVSSQFINLMPKICEVFPEDSDSDSETLNSTCFINLNIKSTILFYDSQGYRGALTSPFHFSSAVQELLIPLYYGLHDQKLRPMCHAITSDINYAISSCDISYKNEQALDSLIDELGTLAKLKEVPNYSKKRWVALATAWKHKKILIQRERKKHYKKNAEELDHHKGLPKRFLDLPIEAIVVILQKLDPLSFFTMTTVSKAFYSMAQSHSLKNFILNRWGIDIEVFMQLPAILRHQQLQDLQRTRLHIHSSTAESSSFPFLWLQEIGPDQPEKQRVSRDILHSVWRDVLGAAKLKLHAVDLSGEKLISTNNAQS